MTFELTVLGWQCSDRGRPRGGAAVVLGGGSGLLPSGWGGCESPLGFASQ